MSSRLGLTLLSNQYPALHGLRVLGILVIIQVHLAFELAVRKALPPGIFLLSQHGWIAMDLFFVLSGFLIGSILFGNEGKLDTRKILRFYARRSFRIIPLYYVVLTILACSKRLGPLERMQLPREYLYLTNYSDTTHVVMFWGWSLCVEEHFYIAVPFLVIALGLVRSHRTRIALLLALWLSALVVRIAIVHLRTTPFRGFEFFHAIYIPTHTRYDTLAAGVLLAYVHRHYAARVTKSLESSGPRVVLLSAASALLIALLVMPFAAESYWNLAAMGTITGAAYVLLLSFLLYAPRGRLAEWLGAPVFLRFATLGYGVYLVHMPLVLAVGIPGYRFYGRMGFPPIVSFPLAVFTVFGACLCIAYVLHQLVEKPALFLRDRAVPTPAR